MTKDQWYFFTLRIIICLGMLFIQENILWGQLHCLNYTSQDGLPTDYINCAVEDADGFMWFGTGNGICKFDGTTFDELSINNSETGPGGHFITAIEVDDNNNLWVGTRSQGLFHWNRKLNTWEHFGMNKSGYYKLTGNEIFKIHTGQNGKIWYGADRGGLGCIDPGKKTHDNYNIEHLPKRETWRNRIYDLIEDKNDPSILYMVGQGYFYQFDYKSLTFSTPSINVEPKVGRHNIFDPSSIVQSSESEFMIGSWNTGVKSFNLKTGIYSDIDPDPNNRVYPWITNVYPGINDDFWICVREEGIAHLSSTSENSDFYRSEKFNRYSLLKGQYNFIYNSSNGHTWVLTSQGISHIIPEYQAFEYVETNVEGPNIFKDIDTIPNSDRYIASFSGENGPLKIFSKNFRTLSRTDINQAENTFQSVYVSEFFQDRFLCLSDQLYEYNPIDKILLPNPLPDFVPTDGLKDFFVDEHQVLWLLRNGSIIKYNATEEKVEEFLLQGYQKTLGEKIFYHGMAKVGEKIWIATHLELIVLNPEDGNLSYLYFNNKELHERKAEKQLEPNGNSIHQITPINENCSWVLTTEDGIYKVCAGAQAFFSILVRKGKKDLIQLSSPIKMVEGNANDFWVATSNGLVHADSNFEEFKVFSRPEGLRNTNLIGGLKRIDDYLFVGMPKGFMRVNTPSLFKEKVPASVLITNASIDATKIGEDEENNFKHFQNNFSVSVASTNYQEARQVIFAHRLVNHVDAWEISGANEKTFRYDKLPPGKYTFEVKTKSPSTLWSPIDSRTFTITAPIWKRSWFRILSIIGMLAILYHIYRLRLKRKIAGEKIKTEMAELEGKALRAQMNPHFIFNSLNSIKSLIQLDRKDEGILYLTKFSRMVREILTFSKEKRIPLQKELELLGIYLEMESLRFQEQFEYTISLSPTVNSYQVTVPPLLIQPFVENAIWHGLLHKDGDANLEIKIWQEDKFLFITIKDDGIGRKAAAQIKSNKIVYRKTSEGVQLSKNRVKLVSEYAKIDIEDLYENEKAAGTLVTLKLPIQNE